MEAHELRNFFPKPQNLFSDLIQGIMYLVVLYYSCNAHQIPETSRYLLSIPLRSLSFFCSSL